MSADEEAPDEALKPPPRVLIADDEESMRHFVQRGLKRLGYETEVTADGTAAVARWQQQPFDVAVLDLKMPHLDGIGVLARIRSGDPDAIVVLMTAHGTVATAVEAMHLGAADYVTKPFAIDELALRLQRALGQRAAVREARQLRSMLGEAGRTTGIVGQSAQMCDVLQQVELLATSSTTVLLTGESGTGKGLVAKALHLCSDRREGPFVALNCAAVPDTLVESELFGHEAGAFTGAVKAKAGLIRRASRGTLFLDEIADMSLQAQAKIERFLQEREFLPLGGQAPVRVDVRVVAATNQDLPALVRQGRFRQELLLCLDVVNLTIPPLRERREDVPLLVTQTLEKLARKGQPVRTVTPEALGALTAYEWPGNVRELENLVERMVALSGQRTELGTADLPPEVRGLDEESSREGDDSYEAARRRFDRIYFTNLLMRCGGSITAAAQQAGISRGHLHRRLRELQCDVDAAREAGRAQDRPEPPPR